jgi:hypothetical protein
MAKTEAYQMIKINRADIKNAPYNPRKISKEAREKLKRGLEKHA